MSFAPTKRLHQHRHHQYFEMAENLTTRASVEAEAVSENELDTTQQTAAAQAALPHLGAVPGRRTWVLDTPVEDRILDKTANSFIVVPSWNHASNSSACGRVARKESVSGTTEGVIDYGLRQGHSQGRHGHFLFARSTRARSLGKSRTLRSARVLWIPGRTLSYQGC